MTGPTGDAAPVIDVISAAEQPDYDAGEIRASIVDFDPSFVERLRTAGDATERRLLLPVRLFPDVACNLELAAPDREQDGVATWSGPAQLAGTRAATPTDTSAARYVLTVADGVPALSITSASGNYHVLPTAGGRFRSTEEDPGHPVSCATADAGLAEFQRPGFGFEYEEDEPTADVQIKVLMLFTAAATREVGGSGNIKTIAEQAANIANEAFKASDIKRLTIMPVAEETPFRESPSFGADLERITSDEQIAGRRRFHNADVVSLMRGPARGVWGIAWALQRLHPGTASRAFNVVYVKQAVPFGVFAHELGHNLGCAHNRESVDAPGLYPDARGHHFNAPGHGHVGTIMSYFGRRKWHYSNPSVKFPPGDPNGVPTGTASANNARAINASKQLVAKYR